MKTKYILAVLAVIFSLTAAFTNHSEKNNFYPVWKYRSDRTGGEKIKSISANHLADLVFSKEQGIIIMDAREEQKYIEYHIPGAILLDENALPSALEGADMIILYGESEEPVKDRIPEGYRDRVIVLYDGISGWYNTVLFPDFSKLKIRNKQLLEHIISRSRFFGGVPQNMDLLHIYDRPDHFREGC